MDEIKMINVNVEDVVEFNNERGKAFTNIGIVKQIRPDQKCPIRISIYTDSIVGIICESRDIKYEEIIKIYK